MDLVSYHRVMGKVFCRECKFLMKDWGSCGRHLVEVHKKEWVEVKGVIARLRDAEKDIEVTKPLTTVEQDVRVRLLAIADRKGGSGEGTVGRDIFTRLDDLPVKEAWRCTKCGILIKLEKKMKAHQKECVGSVGEKIAVQHLYGGKNCRYFEVGEEIVGGVGASELFNDMMVVDYVNPTEGGVTSNVAEMDGFLATMRFDEILKEWGLSMEAATRLVDGLELDERLYRMAQVYVREAYDLFRRNPLIHMHEFMENKMHLRVGETTKQRYLRVAKQLLVFCRKVCDLGEVWDNGPKGCEEALCAFGGVVENAGQGSVDYTDMCALHEVLMGMMLGTEKWNGGVLMALFIACMSVEKCQEGEHDVFRFRKATEVSPYIAALLHFSRCVVVTEVYGRGRAMNGGKDVSLGWTSVQDKVNGNHDCGCMYLSHCMRVCNNIRYSETAQIRFVKCHKHGRCGVLDGHELGLETLGRAVQSVQEEVKELVYEKLMFGFASQCGDLFWADMKGLKDNFLERTPKYWFASHPGNMSCLNKWRRLFSEHVRKMGFEECVLKGTGVSTVRQFLDGVKTFLERMVWMMQVVGGGPARMSELHILQLRNSVSASRSMFVSNGQLFYIIFYHKAREKRMGAGKPIARFLDEATNRLMMLYLVFVRPLEQITVERLGLCPRPGAGTMGGTGGTNTGHGAEMDTNGLAAYDFVFCAHGTHMALDRLRTGFTECMKRTGCAMSVTQYRHYHCGMVKVFLRAEMERMSGIDMGYLEEVLHSQSGHSRFTANDTYAVSENSLKNLDGVILDGYRKTSSMWQRALSLKTMNDDKTMSETMNSPLRRRVGDGSGSGGGGAGRSELGQGVDGIKVPSALLERFVVSMEKMCDRMESLERTIDGLQNVVGRGGGDGGAEEGTTTGGGGGGGEVAGDCGQRAMVRQLWTEEEILKTLRSMLGGVGATFRSGGQKEAIKLACNGSSDALVILPTGSGKSMIFNVAAMMNRLIYIVVVPLVALQDDMKKHSWTLGIQACLWGARFAAGNNLVLCSVEHVVTEEYRAYVQEKRSLGTLGGIFFDEAHLLDQWKEFRPVMRQVATKIRPPGVEDIPLIALTGSCTVEMEGRIKNGLGLKSSNGGRNVKIVREPCVRKNICYSVQELDEDEVLHADLHLVIRTNFRDWLRSGGGVQSMLAGVKEGTKQKNPAHRTIVYCQSRVEVEHLYKAMSLTGNDLKKNIGVKKWRYCKYHAGMKGDDRAIHASMFAATGDDGPMIERYVMIATSAFGCGIDIPDVRLVVHVCEPRNMLSFVQESGRAGRDGGLAHSVIMTTGSDDEIEVVDVFAKVDSEDEDSELDVLERMAGDMDRKAFGSMDAFIGARGDECRRWFIDVFCDHDMQQKRCKERDLALCDLCMKRAGPDGQIRSEGGALTVTGGRHDGEENAWGGRNNRTNVARDRASDVKKREVIEDDICGPRDMSVYGMGGPISPLRTPVRVTGVKRKISQVDDDESEEEKGKSGTDDARSPFLTKRRLFGSPSNAGASSTAWQGTGSQALGGSEGCSTPSQGVTARNLMSLLQELDQVCALCSVQSRRRIKHEPGPDKQKCNAYFRHCFRCASKTHGSLECPLKVEDPTTVPKDKKRKKQCYTCTMSTQGREIFHPPDTFGTRYCPVKNGIRLAVACFEDEKVREEMDDKFPLVVGLKRVEDLFEFLRTEDDRGFTWLGDVITWIDETVLRL